MAIKQCFLQDSVDHIELHSSCISGQAKSTILQSKGVLQIKIRRSENLNHMFMVDPVEFLVNSNTQNMD